MDQNFLDLLRLFDQHKVKYLIIGGYAVSLYAEPRYTKDLDFWIECSTANARKLMAALQEFGAPLASIRIQDFATPGCAYTAGIPPLRFDILTRIKGAKFSTAYTKRRKVKIEDVPACYVSYETLLLLKKAAGRDQDKADVKTLKRFKPSKSL
jgi:hypothetical protein